MKKRQQKPEKVLTLADGREGVRRYRTDVWMRGNTRDPSQYAPPGFPKTEDGSIGRISRAVMNGLCYRIACFDRVKGKYLWCVTRGPKVPGTNLYEVLVQGGDVLPRSASSAEG